MRAADRVWAGLLLAAALAAPAAAQDPMLARGRQLFTGLAVPACAVCHTLREAGAQGAIGPDLDDLRPDAARVARTVQQGLGNMPSFRGTLAADDIAAVARYVAEVAGR